MSNCGLTHGLFYLARTSVTEIVFVPPVCVTVHVQVQSEFRVPHSHEANLTLRLLMSYMYMEHLFLMFLDHTQRRTTVGRTPLDE